MPELRHDLRSKAELQCNDPNEKEASAPHGDLTGNWLTIRRQNLPIYILFIAPPALLPLHLCPRLKLRR